VQSTGQPPLCTTGVPHTPALPILRPSVLARCARFMIRNSFRLRFLLRTSYCPVDSHHDGIFSLRCTVDGRTPYVYYRGAPYSNKINTAYKRGGYTCPSGHGNVLLKTVSTSRRRGCCFITCGNSPPSAGRRTSFLMLHCISQHPPLSPIAP